LWVNAEGYREYIWVFLPEKISKNQMTRIHIRIKFGENHRQTSNAESNEKSRKIDAHKQPSIL
jgi:hypothetical protein